MALDGFQFGKNHLGWPFDAGEISSAAYLEKLVREGFLEPRANDWLEKLHDLKISNLSDADPGETMFLQLTQPDGFLLIIRKDGKWSVFQDENAAAGFATVPAREPIWLPR